MTQDLDIYKKYKERIAAVYSLCQAPALKKSTYIEDNAKHPLIKEWELRWGVWVPVVIAELKRGEEPSVDADRDEMLQTLMAKITTEVKKPPMSSDTRQGMHENLVDNLCRQAIKMIDDRMERTKWEIQEIHRCINGFGPMEGHHYMHWRHGYVDAVESNDTQWIRPYYRMVDNWIFRFLRNCQDKKRGCVVPKRRRVGVSWALIAYSYYEMVIKTPTIAFTSKDEGDATKFINRLRTYRNKMPSFLTKALSSNSVEIQKWKPQAEHPFEDILRQCAGTMMLGGDSTLRNVNGSTPSNLAGDTCSLIIIDEIGEISNPFALINIADPMLAGTNGVDRAGALFTLGTVGRMERAGHKTKELWRSGEAFDLDQGYIDGTMGVVMDKFGNDDRDASRKKIQRKRNLLEKHNRVNELIEYKQMFPLSIDDAFQYNDNERPFQSTWLDKAEDNIEGFKKRYGVFSIGKGGNIVFNEQAPNPSGDKSMPEHIGYNQWVIHEDRKPHLANKDHPYFAGADPLDLVAKKSSKKKYNYKLSDISCVIIRNAASAGEIPGYVSAEYAGRHDNLDDDFRQIYLGLQYFYGAKVNIERQKGSLLLAYIQDKMKAPELIASKVGEISGLDSGQGTYGFHSTEKWWLYAISNGRKWWQDKWHSPVSRRLIHECRNIRNENTDVAVAWLGALQLYYEYIEYIAAFGEENEVYEANYSAPKWIKKNGFYVPVAN